MTGHAPDTGTRLQLVTTTTERLMHIQKLKDKGEIFTIAQVAALIIDDLMASPGMAMIIERTTTNGLESGHEQGLREAITAVGNLNRQPDEHRNIDYEDAQRAIAQKSKRGMEKLWTKSTTK